MEKLVSSGGTKLQLSSSSSLTKLRSSARGRGLTPMGAGLTPSEKIAGFTQSALESFPELFGIEPSATVQEFRAQAPVSGAVSQMVGAFVPYVGAAKLARAAPLTGQFIRGAEGLARGSTWRKYALGAAAEAAVVETGRIGIGATPLPEMIMEGVRGEPVESRPLTEMLGEGALNIAGGAVLGAGIGGLVGRFAKGPKIEDLVPEATRDVSALERARALNQGIAEAQDPAFSRTIPEEHMPRLDRERAQALKLNLLGIEPKFTDTGDVEPGPFRIDQGKVFRPLEGDDKNRSNWNFLNRTVARFKGSKVDNLVKTRKLWVDPTTTGRYTDEADFRTDIEGIGVSLEDLGLNAQDIQTVEIRAGQGKQVMPEGYNSPLDFFRNKVGEVQEFYHGTGVDIERWVPGDRGGISFSTNPKFASNWAEGKGTYAYDPATGTSTTQGARVYVTFIKKTRGGDFQKPEDVLKALKASGNENVPGMKEIYEKGGWGAWENLEMMKKAGWDTVFMVEDPGAAPGSINASKNIFVTDGDLIYSAFDPSVQGAKNSRLLTQRAEFNKKHNAAVNRAKQFQNRFSKKPWADVGSGWKLAREKDGLYVMAKKVRGDAFEPAPGDRWVVFRTDRPQVFAQHAGKTNELFMNSAYFPMPPDQVTGINPTVDAGVAFLKQFAEQPRTAQRKQTASGARAALREVREFGETYAAPSAPLFSRNPAANLAWQYVLKMRALTDDRLAMIMRGADADFDPKRTVGGNVVAIKEREAQGLAKAIEALDEKDLADIRMAYEGEVPLEQLIAANQRTDINGEKIVSDRALGFMTVMQGLDDQLIGEVAKMQDAFVNPDARRLIDEFRARRGHYIITREYPGAYRIMLKNEAGELEGIASGRDPKEAREVAADLIDFWGKRGKPLFEGGMVDEAMRTPEDLQKFRAAILKPGFIRNRGDLLGFELQRGEKLDGETLSSLIEKNLRRRLEYIRNTAMLEHLAEFRAQMQRQSPQDSIAFEKRLQILVNKDEGEFARTQNKMMDKALAVAGLHGKDSASAIVQTSQRLLTSFTMAFGNISQPTLNVVGIFQTLLPEIAYNMHATPEQLARNYVTMPLLDGAGNVKGTMGALSEVKIMMNSIGRVAQRWEAQPDDYKNLVQAMIRQGQLAPKFAEESFGVDGSILARPFEAFKTWKSFTKFGSALNDMMLSKSEELARTMTINAAYELAKLRGMDEGHMIDFTREMIGKVNFSYATADRATVFTTPLGSLAGTFKNWMFHYMANMVKYAEGGPATRAALLWQTAATAAIGGTAATPFITPIADGASKFLTNQSWMETLYGSVDPENEWVADGVMYGLPGALGVSFASQASSPGADPVRDATMIFSFAAFDRMKALSGATRDALVAYRYGGESPWEDENVRGQLVRALAPRTIFRSMALTQDMGVRSLSTGYDVTGPMGLGSAVLYAAGFNPTELDKTYEVYNRVRDKQQAQRKAVGELGQTLAEAWDNDDDRLANRVFTRAMAIGVDTSSVLRSAKAREKRGQETQLEFAADAQDIDNFGFMFEP